MIRTHELCIGHTNALARLGNLTFENGEFIGIIGKNGIGKTTLLKTLAGLLPPVDGSFFTGETRNDKIKRAEMSRQTAMLLTDEIAVRHISVWQMAAYGRYPYHDNSCHFTEKDKLIIDNAVRAMGMAELSDTPFDCLSDGEKQKTLIAKTIAQDTENILLDEPTSHLDLPSKIKTLIFLKEWARKNKKCVIFSIHETELAFQTADEILFLHNGKATFGTARDIVACDDFKRDFLDENITFNLENMKFDIHWPQ